MSAQKPDDADAPYTLAAPEVDLGESSTYLRIYFPNHVAGCIMSTAGDRGVIQTRKGS
jgi:hypothetical protein